MRFQAVRAAQADCPVDWACSALEVSSSGFFAWNRRLPSAREKQNEQLLAEIETIYKENKGRYGSPRIWEDLREKGSRASRGRVERVMRCNRIPARRRRRYVTTTTEPAGDSTLAPNLLARHFAPGAVDAWVADLTALRTQQGFLHLAVVIDLRTRQVLGWSMAEQPLGRLALDALKMALGRQQPAPGLLHHSDRGGHYTSRSYQALLAQYGITQSMSARGDCYDNAVAESFFASLKRELLYPGPVRTMQEARLLVFDYIEVYYNRRRRHSALGYQTPQEYAKLHPVR